MSDEDSATRYQAPVPRAPAGRPSLRAASQRSMRRGLGRGNTLVQRANNTGNAGALVARNQELQELTTRELKVAFDFLDVDGEGFVTLQGLKKRLVAFYGGPEHVPMSELKFLMGSKKKLSFKDLRRIVDETAEVLQSTNTNPLLQAFSVYDPHGTGFVDIVALSEIIERLGYGTLTDEDMQILVETIDQDGDGKIGLDDFQHMLMLESAKTQTQLQQT